MTRASGGGINEGKEGDRPPPVEGRNKEIFFDDDTFTANPNRVVCLCRELRPFNLTWSTTARVDANREVLQAMKEAGLRLLVVGYESGSQAILDHIRKGTTLAQARALVLPFLPLPLNRAIIGCDIAHREALQGV